MNHKAYQNILVEGKLYNKENITELVSAETADLYLFLQQWMDDSPEITVRTSGSTGIPKEIKVKKDATLISAKQTLGYFGLKPGMTALLCLPVSYIAGKMMVVRAILGQLNMIAVTPSANPLKDISSTIDFASFTPMQILNGIRSKDANIKHLRKVIIGGGKVDKELNALLQDMPFEAFETYGMTETLSHIALRRINGATRQEAFYPLEGVVLDKDARGCLSVYAEGITDKTLTTNDIAEFRSDGSFNIIGRIDNVINSGGIKHSPESIEKKIRHLLNVPFVISALPNKLLGLELVIVTEGRPSDSSSLLSAIGKELSRHELPAAHIILQHFPKTESGKIKRAEIMKIISGA